MLAWDDIGEDTDEPIVLVAVPVAVEVPVSKLNRPAYVYVQSEMVKSQIRMKKPPSGLIEARLACGVHV